MRNKIFIVSVFALFLTSSCQENPTQDATIENSEDTQTEFSETQINEVEKVASVNQKGDTLHLIFDNLEGSVEIEFKDISTSLET